LISLELHKKITQVGSSKQNFLVVAVAARTVADISISSISRAITTAIAITQATIATT
jgi:hypothetical protein